MTKKSFKTGFDSLLGASNISKKELPSHNQEKSKEEKRATFLIDIDQYDKIKSISYWDRKLIKEVLFDALSSYIKSYENKNGKIKTP